MRYFYSGEKEIGDGEMEKKITVVIPAYNEEPTIGEVLEDLQTTCSGLIHEIIVVDDGSKDETARIAERKGARVIRHRVNIGYGAALKAGIRSAKSEILLTMDSDGQHRSEDVLKLWECVNENDMVVGERAALFHSPVWRMPGKWLLGLMANYVTRCRIPDLNSGFRFIRRDVALKYLHLCPSGFSFSTTMTMALLNRGYRVAYVPIEVKRREGTSTVSVMTGLDTIVLILRIASLFDPLRIFVPLSVSVGVIGGLLGIYYFLKASTISGAPILLAVTAMLLFVLGLLCDQISQLRLERYE